MDATVLGGIFAASFTAVAGIIVAFIAKSSSKRDTVVKFTESVITRLEKVEDDLADVQEKLSVTQQNLQNTRTELHTTRSALAAAIWFIKVLVQWGKDGADRTVPQAPRELHEYLNTEGWDDPNTP